MEKYGDVRPREGAIDGRLRRVLPTAGHRWLDSTPELVERQRILRQQPTIKQVDKQD